MSIVRLLLALAATTTMSIERCAAQPPLDYARLSAGIQQMSSLYGAATDLLNLGGAFMGNRQGSAADYGSSAYNPAYRTTANRISEAASSALADPYSTILGTAVDVLGMARNAPPSQPQQFQQLSPLFGGIGGIGGGIGGGGGVGGFASRMLQSQRPSSSSSSSFALPPPRPGALDDGSSMRYGKMGYRDEDEERGVYSNPNYGPNGLLGREGGPASPVSRQAAAAQAVVHQPTQMRPTFRGVRTYDFERREARPLSEVRAERQPAAPGPMLAGRLSELFGGGELGAIAALLGGSSSSPSTYGAPPRYASAAAAPQTAPSSSSSGGLDMLLNSFLGSGVALSSGNSPRASFSRIDAPLERISPSRLPPARGPRPAFAAPSSPRTSPDATAAARFLPPPDYATGGGSQFDRLLNGIMRQGMPAVERFMPQGLLSGFLG